MYASNGARLEQSYREIADQAKIAGRKDPKVNIFKLIHDWLRDAKNGKWLLILDNVDDQRIFDESPSSSQEPRSGQIGVSGQPFLAYLSRIQNGSILITSRSRGVALRLVEQSDIILVEPMDNAHALKLFEKKLGDVDNTDITELATALEFVPLAIVQAAAYISQRSPRYSVRQYLEDFQKRDRKKKSLLNHEGGQLRRDWEAKNSIITTWEISFDHIRLARPSAANLLSLMSFFDRQGIPEDLVLSGRSDMENENSDDEDSTSESISDDGFEDDILTLRNYSFISVNAAGSTFEMHRLVQLATQRWLSAHGQLERWKCQFIKNLLTEFPTSEYKNWEKCRLLFPHVRSAEVQPPDEKDSLHEWALLLDKAASYAWRVRKADDMEKMSLKAMKIKMQLFGQEHQETLNAMGILGFAYSLGGRWKETEELQVHVLEASRRVLGAEHPDTLIAISNLALTYSNLGRWKEAEELQVQVLEASRRVLGAEHPDTLIAISNLALTYSNLGRWKEAEELQVQVLEASKRVLGAENLDTLNAMNSLALTYSGLDRWKEGEELQVQVLEASKRVLGVEHPTTLTAMSNLAYTWKSQGRDSKALELMEECTRLRLQVLGNDHPYTNDCLATLSQWQAEQLDINAADIKK